MISNAVSRQIRIWPTVAAMLVLATIGGALPATAQVDLDGDGYADTDGDLYDVPGGLVTSPELVNPGAYDIPGNGIDDDCDGTIDNPAPGCSTGDQLSGVTGSVLAQGMDICQTTVLSPPSASERRWGLISAELRRSPTNATAPSPFQAALSAAFGEHILPNANGNLAVLSTGTARDADQPNYMSPIPGFEDATNSSLAPAAFLAARGNKLYSKVGCPTVSGSNPVHDMVLLRLSLRVPTNADGVQFQHLFLTSQFPDVCTQYNDHFLALITTTAAGIPADRNIAFDQMYNPVSVQTAFYPACTPVGSQPCPYGPAQLAGTGFDPAAAGSTGWNTTVAPVIGGEIITLEFYIFDVGDHQFDSTVLLDNLTWHVIPQAPPLSAVDDQPLPGATAPLRAAPNPFNPSTRLSFTLPRAGAVQLAVFDLAGRRIATLVDAALEAGDHQAVWDGRGDDGQAQPSGVYHARLTGGGQNGSASLVLLK